VFPQDIFVIKIIIIKKKEKEKKKRKKKSAQTSSTSDYCRGPMPSPEAEVLQIHSNHITLKFHHPLC
jgi:hypothetical protein